MNVIVHIVSIHFNDFNTKQHAQKYNTIKHSLFLAKQKQNKQQNVVYDCNSFNDVQYFEVKKIQHI